MGTIQKYEYMDYDKITDLLMFFSNDILLKFSVLLSKNVSKTNKSRKFFHSECIYSSKYMDTNESVSIIRNMNMYYFLIDIKNDFLGSIVLKPGDVEILKMLLDQRILPWFFGNNKAFQIIDNKLYLGEYGESVMYTQDDYKYLGFTPIVITYEDGQSKQGIRINVNNQDTFADLDIDSFMTFVNIIKCTDMYNAACNLINYVKMPPYGINQFKSVGLGSGGYRNDMSGYNNKGNSFLNNAKKS